LELEPSRSFFFFVELPLAAAKGLSGVASCAGSERHGRHQ
jgi:hypothetical protein